MKPYQQVPILECQEPLVPIPLEEFAVHDPHPYVSLSAPYGGLSPYYVRQGVLDRLRIAQSKLQRLRPGWRLQIFDAYRPIAVQQFMVDYTFQELVRSQNLIPNQLTEAQRQTFLNQVYQFWAVPSDNPATPPPHSTGAAVDLTLIDETGTPVEMGSPIDELSPRSHPNYYALNADPTAPEYDPCSASFHANRQLLNQAMSAAEFCRHPHEWWHFSFGDQMWAWLANRESMDTLVVACYGRYLPS